MCNADGGSHDVGGPEIDNLRCRLCIAATYCLRCHMPVFLSHVVSTLWLQRALST